MAGEPGPASIIQIMQNFQHPVLSTAVGLHGFWMRAMKPWLGFKANNPKFREKISLFFLPWQRIEPRTFQSWVFCLAIWAITPRQMFKEIKYNKKQLNLCDFVRDLQQQQKWIEKDKKRRAYPHPFLLASRFTWGWISRNLKIRGGSFCALH